VALVYAVTERMFVTMPYKTLPRVDQPPHPPPHNTTFFGDHRERITQAKRVKSRRFHRGGMGDILSATLRERTSRGALKDETRSAALFLKRDAERWALMRPRGSEQSSAATTGGRTAQKPHAHRTSASPAASATRRATEGSETRRREPHVNK